VEAVPPRLLSQSQPHPVRSRPIWRPALALATIVLMAVAALGLWQSMSAPAFATLANPGSAVRGYRLADGTSVFLDAGAEVGVSLRGDRREIEVRKGRARIKGGLDPRPFEVLANRRRIVPGPTQLDVAVDDDRVTISALDGGLMLERSGSASSVDKLALGRGEAVTVDATGQSAVVPDTGWPLARVHFEGAPLGRILAAANRHGDPQIATATLAISSLPVTGVLDLRDTRRLARKLAAALALRIDDGGDRLILSR